MSKLIINEEPRFVLPSLAIEIGLEEAIALQQIHWRQKWLEDEEIESHFIDGHYWVMKTYSEWVEKDFPFWNEAKMGRIMRSLEELPFIVVCQHNKQVWDHTKAYRIDHQKFMEWEACIFDDSNIDSLDDSNIDTLHSNKKLKESEKPKKQTTEEIIAELERDMQGAKERKGKHPRKEQTLQAMAEGAKKETSIKDAFAEYLGLTPIWDYKSNQEHYQFFRAEADKGRHAQQFAEWWFENDWRGKKGQSPSMNQVRTMWLQAFRNKTNQPRKRAAKVFGEAPEGWYD